MDFSDKVNSSSTPSKLSASPMSSKSDENDPNYLPSVANLNPRKLREAEKIVKKKVLGERNEALDFKFSDNPLSGFANVEPKSSSCQIGSGSLSNSMSSDFDGNEENSPVDELSSWPYDPLTNYLSPRPKFLRYKPSRRREIFLRQQNDRVGGNFRVGDSLDLVTTVGENSLSVSPTSSSEEEETGKLEEKVEESEGELSEIDEELEDEGEEDEDRGWTVKELFKFLLIIAALVFSTAYITSMNLPTPSFEVSGAFRSGFCPILNHTGEFGGSNSVMETLRANGRNFWNEEVTETASRRESEGRSHSQFFHQEDTENDTENIGLMEETEIRDGENEDKTEDGNLVEVEYKEQVEEATEKPQAEGTIAEEMAEGDKNVVEFSEVTVEDVGDHTDQENGKECDISDTIALPSEVPENDEFIEASKPTIFNGFDQDNLVPEILDAFGDEYSPPLEAVEMVEAGDRKMVESNKGEAASFVPEARKITMLERTTNSICSFGGITYLKDLEKLKSEFMELVLTESLLKAVLGVSVSSAIFTYLVLCSQFKKKNDKKEPVISVSAKPVLQSPVAEAEETITRESKPPSIKPTCDIINSLNCEPIGNVDSFKIPSSSIHSRNEVETFKELYHHDEAPTVQFLSEFVVGEISSSLKNKRDLKNRLIEAEDSSFSVSAEEKPVSRKMHSEPTNTNEQALSEFSTMNSSSHGSHTIKKKTVKKEVGGDKEVQLNPTPVRRSTRIRNRIVSP